jgi:Sec-independent protein translocase protein TatA
MDLEQELREFRSKFPELGAFTEDSALEYGKGPQGSWTWELVSNKSGESEYVGKDNLAQVIAQKVGITAQEVPGNVLAAVKQYKEFDTTVPDVLVFQNVQYTDREGASQSGPFLVIEDEQGNPQKGYFLKIQNGQRGFVQVSITTEVEKLIKARRQSAESPIHLQESFGAAVAGAKTALSGTANSILDTASKIPIFGGIAKGAQKIGQAIGKGVDAYKTAKSQAAAEQQQQDQEIFNLENSTKNAISVTQQVLTSLAQWANVQITLQEDARADEAIRQAVTNFFNKYKDFTVTQYLEDDKAWKDIIYIVTAINKYRVNVPGLQGATPQGLDPIRNQYLQQKAEMDKAAQEKQAAEQVAQQSETQELQSMEYAGLDSEEIVSHLLSKMTQYVASLSSQGTEQVQEAVLPKKPKLRI